MHTPLSLSPNITQSLNHTHKKHTFLGLITRNLHQIHLCCSCIQMETSNSAAVVNHQTQPPRMLKDFLQDQNLPFPRKKSTISLFINAAVKRFPFAAVKSPSILRRSISRRLSKSKREKNRSSGEPAVARTTSVTVKDILRWKSFRDLAAAATEEIPSPAASPSRFTTTTTTGTTTSAGSSSRSSWCDSDFSVGDSPVWFRCPSAGFSGDGEAGGKNFHVNVIAGDRLRETSGATQHLKDQGHDEEEEEQYSPVSVLDFSLQEQEEETYSSFHQTLANMERRRFMLMQRIQEFENLAEAEDDTCGYKNAGLDDEEVIRVEEKAIQLMNLAKETSSAEECDANVDYLLLDFFRDELITVGECHDQHESQMLRMAKAWVNGEDDGSLEWELEGTRDVCIRDMEKRGRWTKFEEEQKEMGIEIETLLFNHLLDELSNDLLNVQSSDTEDISIM